MSLGAVPTTRSTDSGHDELCKSEIAHDVSRPLDLDLAAASTKAVKEALRALSAEAAKPMGIEKQYTQVIRLSIHHLDIQKC